jgi:pyruvate dehydrogenase E2 component (dihydrolipoamide acetyltransferase)
VDRDVDRALGKKEEPVRAESSEERNDAPVEVAVRGVRARIARRMQASHQATVPVTLTIETNVTALVELRERLKARMVDELGFKIGYNALLIKVVARALQEFPYMNARLDRGDGDNLTGATIQQFKRVHVGLAVDTERGLLVPVVQDADRKSVVEIARDVRELVERVRSGSATPSELSGGTFTITNLGMYDIDAFTPVINIPEVAILGVGRIKPVPTVVDQEIAIQKKMWLSLTFDHRLVDGGPAARFLQRVRELIEEPDQALS